MTRHRSAPAIALSALVALATTAPALAQTAYDGFDRDDRNNGMVAPAAESTTASWELLAQNDGGFTAPADASQTTPLILYRPPARGTPAQTVNGAVRGIAQRVELLAPTGHVPLTARAQPTLYWFLASPARGKVHLVVQNLATQRTVADIRWAAPQTPGIHPVRLSDLGIRLAPDTDYRWTLTLERAGGGDKTHGAMIRRRPAAGAATASAVALAGQGYWYDALARLSESLDATPAAAPARAQRAALLQQVGFDAAAAEDRIAAQ